MTGRTKPDAEEKRKMSAGPYGWGRDYALLCERLADREWHAKPVSNDRFGRSMSAYHRLRWATPDEVLTICGQRWAMTGHEFGERWQHSERVPVTKRCSRCEAKGRDTRR